MDLTIILYMSVIIFIAQHVFALISRRFLESIDSIFKAFSYLAVSCTWTASALALGLHWIGKF